MSRLRATTTGPRLEPPEPPFDCIWCDGSQVVYVTEVKTNVGDIRREGFPLPYRFYASTKCPRCDGTGNEPPLDPRDEPALDDRIKERRAEERA